MEKMFKNILKSRKEAKKQRRFSNSNEDVSMLRGEGDSLASAESNEFHKVNTSRSRKNSKYSDRESLDES